MFYHVFIFIVVNIVMVLVIVLVASPISLSSVLCSLFSFLISFDNLLLYPSFSFHIVNVRQVALSVSMKEPGDRM